jgi:hypothetical protein
MGNPSACYLLSLMPLLLMVSLGRRRRLLLVLLVRRLQRRRLWRLRRLLLRVPIASILCVTIGPISSRSIHMGTVCGWRGIYIARISAPFILNTIFELCGISIFFAWTFLRYALWY